jgi:hypothetical protein
MLKHPPGKSRIKEYAAEKAVRTARERVVASNKG